VLSAERAGQADLERLLTIADARRLEYAGYQPEFWHPAADAVARQRAFFASLIDDDGSLVAVAREGASVRGFAVARVAEAPPVYDPGGLTCAVDDFAVTDATEWPTVGPLLLDAVRRWGSDHGATQLVVVVAHLDEAKRAMLRAAQLDLASEWWVTPLAR
jgi:GNAT superfamily N-acetyltransferase